MPPIDVVCDAIVVLKWFHDEGEEEVDSSHRLLELHRDRVIAVSVLDLTAYEIGNALLRGRPGITSDRVAVVLEAVATTCRRVSPSPAVLADAVRMAERHGLTVYDAAYAAVAAARHAHLATLDRALFGAELGRRPSDLLRLIDPT